MATFTKNELRQLSLMNDVNFCFAVCEKLLENHTHINEDKVITKSGEEYDNNLITLKYFVERLLFQSSRIFNLRRDLDEVLKKHQYIFQMELSSSDGLASMLGS